MSISRHMAHSGAKLDRLARFDEINQDMPKYSMPSESMSPRSALTIVQNELRLDGNPDLNLASFVTTEVETEAMTLMTENLNKNLPDIAQYPQVNELQDRCVNILASLFHAPGDPAEDESQKLPNESKGAVGTATVGSSEAILLAGLALKWRWRARYATKQGKQAHEILERPNLIFSAAVHVSVLKLCRYFDIEARIVPLEKGKLTLDITKAINLCDEKTCGVLAVLGTTLTGEFEDISLLNSELLKLRDSKGLDIPIHVDGASGAMVAPFVFPDLQWDFRLEQVRSINLSGHKFGQSLPGLGWVIWRTREDLPEDLIFHVNYLGVDEPTYTLNFSRSAGNVVVQYYTFLRLGFEGYKRVMELQLANAEHISQALQSMAKDLFVMHSHTEKEALPLVAFSISPVRKLKFTATTLVHWLRERGWIIPAYSLPNNVSDITVMRLVIRETLTKGMAEILIDDIRVVLISLASHYGHTDLIEELKAARNTTTTSRRSEQHRERTRQLLHHTGHHHQHHSPDARHEEHVTSPEPVSSSRDAHKVRQMSKQSSGGEFQKEAQPESRGAPTSHTIC